MQNTDIITSIDIISEICKVLMESGVGLSQIESYMDELFDSFGITETAVFAIPQLIEITYTDNNNNKNTTFVRCKSASTNLERIEKTCKLINSIKHDNMQLEEIYEKLDEVHEIPGEKWWERLFPYIGVSCTFTFLSVGLAQISTVEKVALFLSAIFCSIVTYLGDRVLAHAKLSDVFCKLFSSCLLMLSVSFANLLCLQLNVELYSSYVLMGTIMLIVPGVKLTSGMRDLLSGNVLSAIILISESVLSTIGIAVGIIIVQKLTHCPLMTSSIMSELSGLHCIYAVILTGIGTLFFSMYFFLNKRHLLLSFLAGAITWMSYICGQFLAKKYGFGYNVSIFVPNFFAAVIATAMSEMVAFNKKWPSMLILFPAIISLLPGGSLYSVIYSVFNGSATSCDVSKMVYTVAGLCLGILAIASISRVGIAFVDSIDMESAAESEIAEKKQRIKNSIRKAKKLFNIAMRYARTNLSGAYEFHKAADNYYKSAIRDIEECINKHGFHDNEIKEAAYKAYTGAGINDFWIYKRMVRLDIGNIEQRKTKLTDAKNKYLKAKELTARDNRTELCILDNWMAVMAINEARYEENGEKQKKLDQARCALESALQNNPRHGKVYLNLAEVSLAQVAAQFGFEHGMPIRNIVPGKIDQAAIENLFAEIERNLKKSIACDPLFPNGYYKMGQLQTYKIFYRQKVHENNDITDLEIEANKWFMSVPSSDKSSLSYLLVYREYLELTDFDFAKEINDIIAIYDENASQNWKMHMCL